jgi:diguanylate cyclase (GGDEF)-like protein
MSADRRTTRVLIVDEAEIMHQIFCDILDPCAAAVEAPFDRFALSHARSGGEAINLVSAATKSDEEIAVAFIDLRLGDRYGGLQTAIELWARDPEIQIVICTADEDLDWRKAAEPVVAHDKLLLLKRPFHADEILQLATNLSQRRLSATRVREQMWRLRREVDRRLEVEATLRRMAEHDALTKLPNRSVLIERLNAILHARRQGQTSIDALLFMDLDDFKTINDSLGHNAGDELLNQVANRLRTCVRTNDSERRGRGEIVRLGGDEFVVLLEQLSQSADAITVARRIVDRIAEPFTVGDRSVRVGSSIGVAFVDSAVGTPEAILKNADTAMYRAKLSGKGRVAIFDSGMNQDVNARLEMESALRSSLANDELNILYQPVVDLTSGEIRSVEALLRWTTVDGQAIPPSRFVPLAEEIGLITEIGYWTIHRAVDQILEIDQATANLGNEPIDLSINISHVQLAETDFENQVGQILDAKGFARGRLKLEINEAIAMRRPAETAKRLHQLQKAGFGICMDDFGTGHSSLACFHQFRIETVKIDRAFVGSIAHNESHQAIVEAVIQLAHSLRANVVAEGLETPEQILQLRQLGCDHGQGYAFALPMSQSQLSSILVGVDPATRLTQILSGATASATPAPGSDGSLLLSAKPAGRN